MASTKTLTFKPSSASGSIGSKWTSVIVPPSSQPSFGTTPTTGNLARKVNISGIPSDAKITKVTVSADVSDGKNWSVSKTCGSISPKTKSVTLNVSAKWIGAPGMPKPGGSSATASISNMRITVTYKKSTSGTPAGENTQAPSDPATPAAEVAPNSLYRIDKCDDLITIHDKKKKKKYQFDGVVKVGYSFGLTIDDENKKSDDEDYSNGAKRNPIEITAEVAMSDCNKGTSYLTGSGSKRAKTALSRLTKLQKSRRPLEVITKYKTYKKMLIKSISVSQDETNAVGWTASIVFHERIEKKKSTSNNSVNNTIDDDNPTPANETVTG